MRAAVYSGTRNVYEQMLTASKSLLMHSNVEKIYFLIEDDEFPFELPPEIECINIKGQQFFPETGPNYDNVLSYMVLIRAAYSKIFPDLDRILTIDMDTVVNENISELWELNLDDYYLAAAQEMDRDTFIVHPYINLGVAMLNLKKLREDKKDDEIINALNTYYYRYNEQDCFNELCYGHILYLSNDYNASIVAANPPQHEKITHFAALYNLSAFRNFDYYKQLPVSEIQRNLPDKFDLDIIIPTYKDKDALRRTLNSIPSTENIKVIVIDDCSNMDYNDILEEYPWIYLYQLDENRGPGVVRQCGLSFGTGMYVLFLDAGDYFYNDGLKTILDQIKQNTYIKMYSFSYVFDNNNKLADKLDYKTIGKVYKRSFLEMHNIYFSEQGSYANEDYGFIMAVRLILENLENYGFTNQIKHIQMPTFYQHIDKNSLTNKKENNYNYTKLPYGVIVNGLHAIQIAKNQKVSIYSLLDIYNDILVREYTYFLDAVINQPESLASVWLVIKDFYMNHYRVYIKVQKDNIQFLNRRAIAFITSRNATFSKRLRINIRRFMHELETENSVPEYYYNYKDITFVKPRSDNNAPVSRETTQRLQESNSEEEH